MKNRKDDILSEALRLFSERGYDAVSMEEIGTAVGMKAPSLYNHFKGKRDIFDAILKKTEEADAAAASDAGVPGESAEAAPESYRDIALDDVAVFSKQMLRHWTKDVFFSRFRRFLTIEQYGIPEMRDLYHQYLCAGPVGYLADIFTPHFGSEAAALAARFYAPQFLAYSLFDAAEDKENVLAAVDAAIDRNTAELKGLLKGKNNV